jgi:3'-5' exoribonuclease
VDEFSERFGKDDFLRVQGKASVYLGKMQLVVQDLARLPDGEVDLADYLPVAARSTEELVGELRTRVGSLTDPHLRRLLEAFLADPAFLQLYATAPAAKTMHHVYLGGLLEHSLAVADLADDVSRRYPGVQRDLLVAGALLHDIGKVAELCYERSFDYTDEGKLIGHIVMGVEMVEEKVRQLPDFPRSLATLVKHLLLSHHGQYEFGSPKRPKTLEAVILNFLDDLDSKINGVRTHIERDPDNGSAWTSYHRLYDRYFFKETLPGTAQREEPTAALPAAPFRATSPEPKPEPKPERTTAEKERKRFGFTLADQLKGKSLDLFAADEQEKE